MTPEAKQAALEAHRRGEIPLNEPAKYYAMGYDAATVKLREEFEAKEDRRDEQEAEYIQKMTKELTAQIADRAKLREDFAAVDELYGKQLKENAKLREELEFVKEQRDRAMAVADKALNQTT